MENVKKKIEYLIADTSAFIKQQPLEDIAETVYTSQNVLDEITSKRQLRRLAVLPYDLKIREPYSEDIKFVTEFSKKTGDYPSLSATDIKIIALTYRFEKEKIGTEHLRKEPEVRKTISYDRKSSANPIEKIGGFYLPAKEKLFNEGSCEGDEYTPTITFEDYLNSDACLQALNNYFEYNTYIIGYEPTKLDFKVCQLIPKPLVPEYPHLLRWHNHMDSYKLDDLGGDELDIRSGWERIYQHHMANKEGDSIEDEVMEQIRKLVLEEEVAEDDEEDERNIGGEAAQSGEDSDDGYCDDGVSNGEDGSEDDDDVGWITPENILEVKKQMDGGVEDDKPVQVACISTDFAVQNVLMQIGLNVVSIDGMLIREKRTFLLRCYSCFKITSNMIKVFCPNCGNKTLKRVSTSVNEDGTQQVYINFRKPLTAKGKKYTLPRPRGGRHANNPILCEDQRIPQQKPSRLSRQKNNPLGDDYLAGFSPFVTRDVYSRSAMLGIYGLKNPNDPRNKSRRKK